MKFIKLISRVSKKVVISTLWTIFLVKVRVTSLPFTLYLGEESNFIILISVVINLSYDPLTILLGKKSKGLA